MAKKELFIEWETLEHPIKERGSDWFISVIIVAFAAAVSAVVLQNYMFGVLLIIGTCALLLHAAKIPKKIDVRIYEKGILVDTMLYPFESLRSFYVNEHEGRLFLRTKKLFLPVLILHLEDTDFDEVMSALINKIPEEEIEESFWEKLVEHLGF